MDKRGYLSVGSFLIYFMVAVFIIAFMVIGYSVITTKIKYLTTYTSKDLHTNLLVQRILYSPTCFVYVDEEIGRAYPSILEWRKFSEDQLNKCMISEKRAFQLKLENIDNSQTKIISSTNWRNKGSSTVVKAVLIKDDKLYRGTITVELQNE